MTVSADDDDAGLNAEVKFRIHMGGQDKFSINPTTGLITVNSGADLDIEKFGKQYDLTVSSIWLILCMHFIALQFNVPTSVMLALPQGCMCLI